MTKINFASDNYSGVHSKIMQAILDANQGHVVAYGDDQYTQAAVDLCKANFGDRASVYFVLNGTGANVTSLCAMTRPYEAVICTDKAHIQVDECGAPEKGAHCKLLLVPSVHGKLTIDLIKNHLHRIGDQHHVQPRVISISQSSEYGTVYTPDEISRIAEFAHQHQMYLHMDGARLANAAASLQTTLAALTEAVGVDALSFGGTKNGLMLGEAVIFFNHELAKSFKYIRKQNMQLASKMRFVSAQFSALLSENLWFDNAAHANNMASFLADELRQIPDIKITHPVQANAIFAIFPKSLIGKMQQHYHFYVWDDAMSEVRLMTAFDTQKEHVLSFINHLKLYI